MIFGYARVSTNKQKNDLQIKDLKKEKCDEIICEKISGTTSFRDKRDALLNQIRKGDKIIVWRLDRWGRSLKDLIETINYIKSKNAHFISLKENIDTTCATGMFMFHIMAAMAQFEKSLISERTKAGLSLARSRGRFGGRPIKMNSRQIEKAIELIDEKEMLMVDIAKKFEVSRATLYRTINLYKKKANNK